MAHKKAGSSSRNGRDSVGQRLGVKAGDGQLVPAGSIIVRQRGMTFLAGTGTGLGRDYTVFATVTGRVRFEHQTRSKKRIRVVPVVTEAAAVAETPAAEAAAIHPRYFKAKVHCGTCGTEFEVGSTRETLRVDVCSSCHPFFTGKQMIVDTAGQVERFQRRLDRAETGR
jgi:large subunit ribosomal protein L27